MNKLNKKLPKKVIVWGGTGQAKVVRSIIECHGSKILAVFDDTVGLKPPFPDIPLYRGMKNFETWLEKQSGELGFCVAIGNPHGGARLKFHDVLTKKGLKPVTLIHSSAVLDRGVKVGIGSQIMAGAVITAEAVVGDYCILNTRASVDHECILEDGVEIGPGATLCGLVHVKKEAWICAGATVLPRIKIGARAIVGAGAVVVEDVPADSTVVGVPAKRFLKRS